MSRVKIKVIDGVEYYAQRPDRCEECYWWKNRRTGCILGKNQCYYLKNKIRDPEEDKCVSCPYARGRACVSASCMRDLEADLRAKSKSNPKNSAVILNVNVLMEDR